MPRAVGFIGFGRFGRALAELLVEAGHDVHAYDPGHPPEVHAAPSIEALVQSSSILVVSVPVPSTRAALLALEPHLRPDQIVIDVGSVKTGPERVLSEVLGERIPWVATHPLFGPASLARGERPLEVVLCPNAIHPDAVTAVSELYRRMGCRVHLQDAETHDQAMAHTHVMAFFIAKGLLEIGAGESVEFAPPSFQAIRRTIESVRADAGHLFPAIQQENAFAPAARRKLIDALENIDEQLRHFKETGDIVPPTMEIPDLGALSPDLKETRELIDDLDHELVELLARRAQLAKRARAAKANEGHGVRDPKREKALLESRAEWAENSGLEPDAVRDIFETIMVHSRRLQRSG